MDTGSSGAPEHRNHWGPFATHASDRKYPWEDVGDPAARVYLYFPTSGGWRVKEVVATLKYLSPSPEQRSWIKDASKDLQAIQPLLGQASQVAGLIPGGATASKWMETLSKLRVSSVPQAGEFSWSVGMMAFGSAMGLMQGVAWTLPRAVFQRLGGRITGSLAVSIIPAPRQGSDGGPQPLNALAHAVVYGADGAQYWVPHEPAHGRGFVELRISPSSVAP